MHWLFPIYPATRHTVPGDSCPLMKFIFTTSGAWGGRVPDLKGLGNRKFRFPNFIKNAIYGKFKDPPRYININRYDRVHMYGEYLKLYDDLFWERSGSDMRQIFTITLAR